MGLTMTRLPCWPSCEQPPAPRAARSFPAVAPYGASADAVAGKVSGLATARPDDLSALYGTLVDADERGDTFALAGLAWVLFTIASRAEQAHRRTAALLAELQTAASTTCAGAGSPASLELLRHVLAKHGWRPGIPAIRPHR